MKLSKIIPLAICFVIGGSAIADVIVDEYFQDNMLLQRGRPIVIWGIGEPGEEVNLQFCGQGRQVVVGQSGAWEAVLSARVASSEPCTLQVNEHVVNNILIGDLWFASGQSNMVRPLSESDTYDQFADSTDEQFRLLRHQMQVPLVGAYSQEQFQLSNVDDLLTARWQVSSGAEQGAFSAVAWHFGRVLREQLDIPVGVIQVAVGGSGMPEWIRLDTLNSDPRLAEMVEFWPDDPMVPAGRRRRFEGNFQEFIEDGSYRKYQGYSRHHMEPSMLFDAGIRPLRNVNFKGVIWYQGEANAHRPEDFELMFPMLVDDWRRFFEQGEFPFYFVQLPSFNRETWPDVREIQRRLAKAIPNSGMAVTIDLGLENDIHPKDKQPVGERLARIALSETYDLDVGWRSPEPVAFERDEADILLAYKHVGDGLQVKGDEVQGFETEDCAGLVRSVEAELAARNEIRLIGVPASLKTVRYAHKPYARESANVFDSCGLPAVPIVLEIHDCGTSR